MTTYLLIPGAGGTAWYWHLVVPLLQEAAHEAIAVARTRLLARAARISDASVRDGFLAGVLSDPGEGTAYHDSAVAHLKDRVASHRWGERTRGGV